MMVWWNELVEEHHAARLRFKQINQLPGEKCQLLCEGTDGGRPHDRAAWNEASSLTTESHPRQARVRRAATATYAVLLRERNSSAERGWVILGQLGKGRPGERSGMRTRSRLGKITVIKRARQQEMKKTRTSSSFETITTDLIPVIPGWIWIPLTQVMRCSRGTPSSESTGSGSHSAS